MSARHVDAVRRRLLLRGSGLFAAGWCSTLAACGGGNSSVADDPAAAPSPASPAPSGSGLVVAYDPTDPDVLLAVPLTRSVAASSTVAPVGDRGSAQVTLGGTPSIDPTAGITMGGGSDAVLRFSAIAGIGRLASTGWQLYFEVDRATLAVTPDMSPGSLGVPLLHTQYIVNLNRSDSYDSAYAYAFSIGADKYPVLAVGSGSGVGTVGIPYNDAVLAPSSTHVPVVVWGNAERVGLLIDGIDCGSVASPAALGIANVLQLSAADVARVRHLMLVARAPDFAGSATLKTLAVLGDSYAQFDADYLHSGTYGASAYLQALATITKAGGAIDWNADASMQVFPGKHLLGYGTAAAPLNLQELPNASPDNLWDHKDAAVALLAPAVLVVQSGANDVPLDGSGPDLVRWQAWILEWARWALGVDGYAATSVRRFLFCSTPWSPTIGDSAAIRTSRGARMQAMRDAAVAAVAQFAAMYPDRAGDVAVVDVFEAFGGLATPERYFSDAASADAGEHPSVAGNIVKGQTWGAAVARMLASA